MIGTAFARHLTLILVLACVLPAWSQESRVRQPVALARSVDGSWLLVANRRSGTVSVINLKSNQRGPELEVGGELVDLATLPDGRHFLAVDRSGSALVVLEASGGTIAVKSRVEVAFDPVSVAVDPEGSRSVVASTGSRRLTVSEGFEPPRVLRSIDLPFAPRLMAWTGHRLIVADAFGGQVAVVDPGSGQVESVRSIPGHNIRGLAVSPDGRSLVVAHQVLSRLARSSFEDIHWGTLLNNHLRVLRIDSVLKPGRDADLLKGSRLIDLGETGHAAGDPGAIAFDREGRLAVALTGVGELAFGSLSKLPLTRVSVGQGPLAVLPEPDGRRVYVANTFDDTVAVVEVSTGRQLETIALGPRPDLTAIDRGERLFRNARLSHDGWMSCQSCHTDGQSNGLLADTLGDGDFGGPKRVTSLLGVGVTGPWTWTGSVDRLEDQVRKSIETSMRGRPPTEAQVDDLTAYLRSLPPPRVRVRPEVDPLAAARGQSVFQARKCAECHAAPEYTEAATFDVGLTDESGRRRFNPPSLRGVGDRPSYLHDSRAATLPDVFLQHRHPRDATWSPLEVDDLVAYLKTL